MILDAAKMIGAGAATIGLAGAGAELVQYLVLILLVSQKPFFTTRNV